MKSATRSLDGGDACPTATSCSGRERHAPGSITISRLHREDEHFRRCVTIEFAVKPAEEIGRSRFGKDSARRHAIDFGLEAHMGSSLDLQIAALQIVVELPGERALDVLWTRVVAFDEIAVIGIHDAHQAGEVRRGAGMQAVAEFCRCRGDFRDEIGNSLGSVLKTGRLDALNAFERRSRFWPVFVFHNSVSING